MSKKQSREDLLTRFIDDEECLAPIYEYDSRLNIFRMFDLQDKEVYHSRFLAWLLDLRGNHELGPLVLKALVGKEMNWDSFIVKREWEEIRCHGREC